MSKVFVYDKEEQLLEIRFSFSIASNRPKRNFRFSRKLSEPLGVTFNRVCTKINDDFKTSKKKKNKNADAESVVSVNNGTSANSIIVELLDPKSTNVDDQTPNSDAWQENCTLQINGSQFIVVKNPPLITSLKLPTNIMAQFPVFPRIKTEHFSGASVEFFWFLEKRTHKEIEESDLSESDSALLPRIMEEFPELRSKWSYVGEGSSFTPSNSHIDCRLQVVCIPRSEGKVGEPVSATSRDAIGAGPGHCPFEERHQFTKDLAGENCFRCVSYNILADLYADSDYSRQVLYPYCPPYALSGDYRKHLLCKELLGYNADIICLQEVDKKVFANELEPTFALNGCGSIYSGKADQGIVGLATVYRRSKFKLLETETVTLSKILSTNPGLHPLLEMVKQQPPLLDLIMERSDILQLCVLESVEKPGQVIFLCNTHLFWYPSARNVRLIQCEVAIRYIHQWISRHQGTAAEAGTLPHIVFCGDFNSKPGEGINIYMTSQQISREWTEWREDCVSSGGECISCDGCDLYQPYPFTSACGQPDYTNYVAGFNATIDWIYIHNLRCTQVIPMYSDCDITRHTALPSLVFPSDHLALVCDITWQVASPDTGL